MAINSISGNSLPMRPAAPGSGQRSEEKPARQESAERVNRTEQNTPASIVQRDLPRLDAATREREQAGNQLQRPQPFETSTNPPAELRSRDVEVAEENTVVDRADQARDALKARFEEISRPKPEPRFEARV